MKTVVTVALAAFVGPSCQASQPDPFKSPPIEAEFRWHAREMYESLRKPSCEAPAGFDRTAKLSEEHQSVRSFERQTHATPAQFHAEIASADAAFEQAKDEGCWMEYSELVWAKKHVEMTKEQVRGTLERLRAIAPSLNDNLPKNVAVPRSAPEFRYLVRQLVQFSRPQCRLTTSAENTQVMGPAQSEIERFRNSLEGTPFAVHFDIALKDVAYELSITMVECAAPSPTEPSKLSQEAVTNVRRQIGTIKRLIPAQ